MTYEFSTFGAVAGLLLAIFMIVKKVNPAYSLIAGALIGGLLGGGTLSGTVNALISGAQGMMSPVLRILTSGILAGMLIKTGAAEKIAESIVKALGVKRAVISITLATMIICAVGVFVDIAVITVAPIGLAIGKRAGYSKACVLIAMIGGGKAGNIISPNPNTIATAEAFKVDLSSLIMVNLIPALCAALATILIASMLAKRPHQPAIADSDLEKGAVKELPSLPAALAGPLVVVLLLSLRPLAGISVDPLIALPLGGLICALCTGQIKQVVSYSEFGLSKVVGVSVLLIGTGTVAGIIKASALQYDVVLLLNYFALPAYLLAPISGILMCGATASTTAGATVASQTFAEVLLSQGVPALSSGAMIHAGSTVIDSLPHGSFFHATAGSVFMNFRQRLALIPYEAAIGLTSTVMAVAVYLVSRL